jgi:hypothetical protein
MVMARKAGGVLVFALVALVAMQGVQAGDWKHGVGTGFFALNLDGDLGLDTTQGPVIADIDLDNGDVWDRMESAFGFSAFSAKGKWRIIYGAGFLELEGDGSGFTRPLPEPVSVKPNVKTIKVNVAGVYNFAKTDRNQFGVLFGAEYTKHDWEIDGTVELPGGAVDLRREFDHDWTDAVVGLTHALKISEKVAWTNRIQGGFGGSEGTAMFNTGINWQVAQHWTLNFFLQNTAVEFENDNEGDPEWYLYDVDEFGAGFGFAYIF